MRYTKQHQNKQNDAKRNATWQKFKQQSNQLNAHRRGVRNGSAK
ncbi:hypothetical protein [Loigolactobacillus bifermentans]|nr:hypothetical protein [Loigolactobacillus bifermentans]